MNRLLAICLALVLAAPASAKPRPAPAANASAWVSEVVTRIGEAQAKATGEGKGGTVTVRLRIGASGALEGAAIDESSGSEALDARALAAVRNAGPFAPPPAKLLTLEGFTELSFPLELGPAATR